MGMDCRKAESLFRKWEDSEMPEAGMMPGLRDHLGSCAACAKRYRALMALVARDLDLPENSSDATSGREIAAGRITATVMARIAQASPPSAGADRIIRLKPALVPALAAAAVLTVFLLAGPPLFWKEDTVKVRFSLVAPEAESVRLAADFNGWDGEGFELKRSDPGGSWEIELRLKKGKTYRYNFVIDGERWVIDPASPLDVDDGFGGMNSSLSI
jgi:hypothetical protein